MKTILFSAAAFAFLAVAPASAQMMSPSQPAPMGSPMMGGPMMGGSMMGSGQSCVMNGQFVPCPPMGMQPAMMEEPMMTPRKRMTRRQTRMMKNQNM